jgi:hypothetical protein
VDEVKRMLSGGGLQRDPTPSGNPVALDASPLGAHSGHSIGPASMSEADVSLRALVGRIGWEVEVTPYL